MMPLVYIIVPTHNRKNILEECLIDLRVQTYKNFKIIVVDDGSTDGTSEMLENRFPEVILVNGNGDLWWTGAINKGVITALKYNPEYILTLNDDIEIDKDYLDILVTCSQKAKNSLIGSLGVDALNADNIVYAGTKIKWLHSDVEDVRKKIKSNISIKSLPEIIETDCLIGKGMLIPSRVFGEIGIFDNKRFPHYAADNDFSLTAKEAGYNLVICRDAIVKFHTSMSGLSSSRLYSIFDYFKSLFVLKSSNNIYYSSLLILKHCPKRFLLEALFINMIVKVFSPIWKLFIKD